MTLQSYLLAVSVLLCACSQRTAPPVEDKPAATAVTWSAPALGIPPQSNPKDAFAQPYPESVEVWRGKETAIVKDCASNLDLVTKGYEAKASVEFRALQAMLVRCAALQTVLQGHPASKSFLTGVVLDPATLPAAAALSISPEQEAKQKDAEARGLTWSAYTPVTSRDAGQGAILVSTPGFEQRIEIVGRGDFNGDGLEDWLVEDEARATAGTYRSVRLLLLTRTQPDGPVKLLREVTP